MRLTYRILALFTLLVPGIAMACLNLTSTDLDGNRKSAHRKHSTDKFIEQLTHRQPKSVLFQKIRELRQKSTAKPDDLAVQNDLAVYLAHDGELNEALAILKKIEEAEPGLYNTATNLGTVYELNGNVEKAIHWIREGVSRNPKSHEGSEWIRVRILEVKQQLAKDPEWLKTHSVLGVDFGNGPKPQLPENFDGTGQKLTLETLTQHLDYQLGERVPLVDPPDAIVGDLLFDYANCKALSGDIELAISLLTLAESYGAPQSQILTTRRSSLQSVIVQSYLPMIAFGVIALLGLVAMILVAYRTRLRRRLNSNPTEPQMNN